MISPLATPAQSAPPVPKVTGTASMPLALSNPFATMMSAVMLAREAKGKTAIGTLVCAIAIVDVENVIATNATQIVSHFPHAGLVILPLHGFASSHRLRHSSRATSVRRQQSPFPQQCAAIPQPVPPGRCGGYRTWRYRA